MGARGGGSRSQTLSERHIRRRERLQMRGKRQLHRLREWDVAFLVVLGEREDALARTVFTCGGRARRRAGSRCPPAPGRSTHPGEGPVEVDEHPEALGKTLPPRGSTKTPSALSTCWRASQSLAILSWPSAKVFDISRASGPMNRA